MRLTVSVVAGALVGGIGMAVLGEYRFGGVTVFASAVVLGLFVAEAIVTIGRRPGVLAGILSAVITMASLTGAGWTAEGNSLGRIAGDGWAAVALGGLVAGVRAWWPGRSAGSRSETSQTG